MLDDARLPTATDDNQVEARCGVAGSNYGLFLTVSGQEFAPGIGLTFVGHSYVERPILYRSHLFMGTGAGTTSDGKLIVMRVRDIA